MAKGDEWQAQATASKPSTYLDRGIKIEVPAKPNLEALRKATQYLYELYLSHTADSGGT
jgi:hypothetical protein